jgi:uncharacterized protein YqgV (UPF0045/DUF77 family)
MLVRLEFTVEPFRDGGPGPHVLAAVQAVRDAGLEPVDGPFGTSVEAEEGLIHPLLGQISAAASRAGATGVRMSVHRGDGNHGGERRPQTVTGSDLTGALGTAIAEVEALVGGRLGDLSRSDKQRAARLLSERGVFHLRNAVDEVADAMGVSRATIYNYLAAARRDA